jgi:hypothetical protein
VEINVSIAMLPDRSRSNYRDMTLPHQQSERRVSSYTASGPLIHVSLTTKKVRLLLLSCCEGRGKLTAFKKYTGLQLEEEAWKR